MESTRNRPQGTPDDLDKVLEYLKAKILEQLEKKGWGIYVSSHELLGILDEEYDELRDAVRDNDYHQLWKETLDIAVGAVWGMVSNRTGEMDWPKQPNPSRCVPDEHGG